MHWGNKRKVYRKKSIAKAHGYVSYGIGNFRVYKVRGGWSVGRIKR